MNDPPAPLTPFLASPPENLRLFLGHGSLLPTEHSTRNRSVFCSHLFSRTYELLPPSHRFASHAFSCIYKSLFSQVRCFQKHLRCPLVFSNSTKIRSSLSAAASRAIVSPIT